MNKNLLFGIAILICAILGLIKGIFDRATAVHVTGKVIDYLYDNRNDVYFKILQFQYNGQEMKMKAANGSAKQKGAIGEELQLLYNPKNQKYVNIAGDNKDIIIFSVLIVCGALMIYLGLK